MGCQERTLPLVGTYRTSGDVGGGKVLEGIYVEANEITTLRTRYELWERGFLKTKTMDPT